MLGPKGYNLEIRAKSYPAGLYSEPGFYVKPEYRRVFPLAAIEKNLSFKNLSAGLESAEVKRRAALLCNVESSRLL